MSDSLIDPAAEWKRRGIAFALLIAGSLCLAYYKPIGQAVALGFGAACLAAFFAVSFDRVRGPVATWLRGLL